MDHRGGLRPTATVRGRHGIFANWTSGTTRGATASSPFLENRVDSFRSTRPPSAAKAITAFEREFERNRSGMRVAIRAVITDNCQLRSVDRCTCWQAVTNKGERK